MVAMLNYAEALASNAHNFPNRIGAADDERQLTFREWNSRACRLANAFAGIGLSKGDRIAVLAYNSIEWLEIYAATARAGLVLVPINFRLTPSDAAYISSDCAAAAMIVQDDFCGVVEEAGKATGISPDRLIHFGGHRTPSGYLGYEDLIGRASDLEPQMTMSPDDAWALMYTSGTTGRPKGAIRSHRASALMALVMDVEFGFSRHDAGLLIMPMCHANSLFFATAATYCGAASHVYNRASFDAEHVLMALANGPTFTSLVPTQYVMMLEVPAAKWAKLDTSRVDKLVISSAPARLETKRSIMEYFSKSGLFEFYGSTEAGVVTCLRPEEQFAKLGSVGRECAGTRPVRLLDEAGNEVPEGEVGELFSGTPYSFDGYWNLPDKTAQAFRDGYCSVGDMARRDADGFVHLVDRKSNMIISGGENIYPSEVEAVLGAHPSVRDAAVIGLPDPKWGERVHGVVTLRPNADALEAELVEWCRTRLAGYKRPRMVSIIDFNRMPKTATGKIVHRLLKAQFQENT
jgi:acyl-CoA synthetase (AMP-forming)/AMP-acid ligase II